MGGSKIARTTALCALLAAFGTLAENAAARGYNPGDSFSSSTSASGRYIAYATYADNLGGPADHVYNIYRYDTKRQKTLLISRRSKSQGGAGADGNSYDPSISASGRYIAYETQADNLGGPVNGVFNIYRYDTKRQKTLLISRRSKSQGGAGGDTSSYDPSISASGRYIAYETQADNLGGPANDVSNIYRYDTEREKTLLISRQSKSQGGDGADGNSYDPSISAAGRYIAYRTEGDNLGGPANNVTNIYRYDTELEKTLLISRQSKSQGGDGADFYSYTPSISASGRYIAYQTGAANLGGPANNVTNIYRYDTELEKTLLISRQSKSQGGDGADFYSFNPSISASGRYIAYDTGADNLGGPANDVDNIYRYDTKRQKTLLISRRSKSQGGAGGDAGSYAASISASGRYIAYETQADNLGGPANDVRNIYRYDTDAEKATLISRQSKSQGGGGGA